MDRNLYMKFFDISINTFYLWKKQNRPIINFFSKYFKDSEIEEFLRTGRLEKLESTKNESNNKTNITIGDTVTLKANESIKMNIIEIDDNTATCVWFDSDSRLQKEQLIIDVLLKYVENRKNEEIK